MGFSAEVEELFASVMRRIVALESELADLQRQLGQNSSVSFKRPSSDRLNKSRNPGIACAARRARRPAARPVQHGRTLRRVADPDRVVRHEACACGHCGWPLDPKSAKGV